MSEVEQTVERSSELDGRVMLLVGGLGTRLRSLHPDVPKALVPVAGRPFLSWVLEHLGRQGVRRFHAAAGYRGDQVVAWAEAQCRVGWDITASVEPEPLGTGGGVRFALDYLEEADAFVVMNGDTLLPAANLSWLMQRWHAVAGAKGLVAAVQVEDGQARGGLVCDADGRVTAFMEKTVAGNVLVNGGVYVFDRSALAALERGTACSLEYAIFPGWVKHGQLLAEPVDGPLLDMGTPAGLAETEAWCLAQKEVEADRGS
jgi:NDP-sugar pyrophosphorylase family protein